ncbi:sigma 54-interacting transcriptional regulator [bacterium]|nr:sigma 54-interacting transcriptional regulator [bacterium]
MPDRFSKGWLLGSAGLMVLLSVFGSRLSPVTDADSDMLLKLRGKRPLAPEIFLIYLGEDDIRAMGGFPVTRDYYSYLIHILTEKHAGTIGLDVSFDAPNRQYPEYDRMLADFMESSGKVVLPEVLDLSVAGAPRLYGPMNELAARAACIGFSNLGEAAVLRQMPVIARGDSLKISFGLALAKVYLNAELTAGEHAVVFRSGPMKTIRVPVDRNGCLRMNPAGCMDQVRSMSATALFHQYETNPDSLDFSNTLMLVAATAPSLPVIRATALCPHIPASLIHASVAENILNRNWLRLPPFAAGFTWILFWAFAGIWSARIRRFGSMSAALMLFAGSLLLTGAALILLTGFGMVMPLLASLCLYSGGGLTYRWRLARENTKTDTERISAIESQIRIKENALAEAEQKLAEIEAQMSLEITSHQKLSEASQALAREKEAAVLELEKQVRDLRASVETVPGTGPAAFPEIIHAPDSPMTQVLEMVQKVAHDDIPVLIQGETGTGKELIARAIHQASVRTRKSFVAVNCGALSETLLESELFGHERGAFTGASGQRRGRFELAQGGTIFLDEITETSAAFQAKMLRVLQDGSFERVGGERTLHADVRVIAAHNKNLQDEVNAGRFREDLFFRLNAFPVNLPPLRERPGDIPLIADFFLGKYRKSSGLRVSDAVMEKLMAYRWPGNVRELENCIRRAVLLAQSERRNMIQIRDLPEDVQKMALDTEPVLYHALETQILETLRAFGFSHASISQTARALGNRDRGTITEYFRGLCFQHLAENGDIAQASAMLAGSDDPEIIGRVEGKMREYVDNVRESLAESAEDPTCYKGLPKKFHPFLDKIILNIRNTPAE